MNKYFWLTLKKVGKKHATVHQLLYKLAKIRDLVQMPFEGDCFEFVLELDKEPRLHAHVLFTSTLELRHLVKIIYAKGWHVDLVQVEDDAHLQNIVKYMDKAQGYEDEINVWRNEARRFYIFI